MSTSRSERAGRGPGGQRGGGHRIPRARIGEPAVRHRLLLCMIMVAVLALSGRLVWVQGLDASARAQERSEEHTSELQSRGHLVCRLLLERKKTKSCNSSTGP